MSLCKETSDLFFSCSLISSLWPPRQIHWRIQLICILPVTQSSLIRYFHRSIHCMAHRYEVGVVGRQLPSIRGGTQWLVPNGLSITLGQHQLLMLLTVGWSLLWFLLGPGHVPGWSQDKGSEAQRQPIHLPLSCTEPPSDRLQPLHPWQKLTHEIWNKKTPPEFTVCALLPAPTSSRWRSGSQVKFPLRGSRRADLYLTCYFQQCI